MRSSALRLASVALAFALTAPDSAAGGARIVDAPGLPPFSNLQDAVDAAADGDTILVASGSYDGFTITNKSLHVVGVQGHAVLIDGAIQVQQLAAHRSVVLAGLRVTGRVLNVLSEPALIVTSSLGHVRVESCNLTGGLGGPLDFNDNYGDGGHGVVLQASPQVVFAHCAITGGNGNGDHTGCWTCTGGDGGYGVRVNLSSAAFYQCVVKGGRGGTTGLQGGNGGDAVWQGNSWLFAAGSSFTGGAGGNGEDFVIAWAGDGGDGLFVTEFATAELLDNTYAGGAGGKAIVFPENNGQPGAPIAGPGTVHEHFGEARGVAATRMHFDASNLQVTVLGEPGDKVWLQVSTRPAWRYQGLMPGVHLVANTQVPMTPAGVIPASGSLVIALPIPDLVGQADRVLYLQGLGFDALGDAWLGSPMHTLVLDLGSPPDCNGNQQSDLADTILGTSPDCSPNLVPDECEVDCDLNGQPDACDIQFGTHMDCNENDVPDVCDIAAGLSLDCNANGVPDDCDIASGSSPDSNGNGIPDDCEPNVTWWVDDSAPPGGNGSAAAPFQTILQAMLPAIDGDEILLRDGVYVGSGNREIAFGGRAVTVRSEHGPASCVIDLQGLGRAFTVDSAVESGARIEGLTFRDGFSSDRGGAIHVTKAPIAIRGCVFESCQVTTNNGGFGGAIYLASSAARIEDCVFLANSVQGTPGGGGGAIYSTVSGSLQPDPLRILRCTFLGNSGQEGGAVHVSSQVQFYLSHCRFLANVAVRRGGGLAARMDSGSSFGPISKIGECLFAGNIAGEYGGGVHFETPCCTNVGVAWLTGSTLVANQAGIAGGGTCVIGATNVNMVNCIAWGSSAPNGSQLALGKLGGSANSSLLVERCDVQGGQAGVHQFGGSLLWVAGNLDVDPQFADVDGPDNDPQTYGDNDYRPIAGAPVNDAGHNGLVLPDLTDVDGDGNTNEPTPLDLDLTLRFVEDLLAPNVGAGTPPLVDMGCYER
jgi:hypothetical protein